jgi:subtilisin family serine protease
VTAAGNLGRNDRGQPQFGGITSPGNAPWVLTVGAANHHGTVDRRDDSVAAFSSLGPSRVDLVQKPDLVAPGVGTESLADVGSTLFVTNPAARLWGTVPTAAQPYLSLSGTSMAAPVVSATVALMLQANPALTPSAVKGILQVSAERHQDYSLLAQGAGFLDARAAVELARDSIGFEQSVAFDGLVAYEDEGSSPPACEAGTDCVMLTESCLAAGCFEREAGSLVGVSAAPTETVMWAAPAERPGRRRIRASGRSRRRKES